MNADDVYKFTTQVRCWAAQRPDILALGYVGSWARGTAKPALLSQLKVAFQS